MACSPRGCQTTGTPFLGQSEIAFGLYHATPSTESSPVQISGPPKSLTLDTCPAFFLFTTPSSHRAQTSREHVFYRAGQDSPLSGSLFTITTLCNTFTWHQRLITYLNPPNQPLRHPTRTPNMGSHEYHLVRYAKKHSIYYYGRINGLLSCKLFHLYCLVLSLDFPFPPSFPPPLLRRYSLDKHLC